MGDQQQIVKTVEAFLTLQAVPLLINVLLALLIFFIGKKVAKMIVSLAKKVMIKAKLDNVLVDFLGAILFGVLLLLVIIAAAEKIGIETTSLVALLGAAGLAVGLALKDSLSNFASGVLLIIFRPFKVGDFIEAAGVSGIVENITIFNTMMRSGDNKQIIVPNGGIYGDTIINYSAKPTRRVDLVFGIGYDDDLRKAKALLLEILEQDERILDDPKPAVWVAQLGDSSINFNVRPWVASKDYWPVYGDLQERVKLAFDEAGIGIPFPQMDVHIHKPD